MYSRGRLHSHVLASCRAAAMCAPACVSWAQEQCEGGEYLQAHLWWIFKEPLCTLVMAI